MPPPPERPFAFRPGAFCVALLFGFATQYFIRAAANPVEASLTYLINAVIKQGFRDVALIYQEHFYWQILLTCGIYGGVFLGVGFFIGRRLLRQR